MVHHCKSITVRGYPCSNHPFRNDLCWIHLAIQEIGGADHTPSVRCVGFRSDGERCWNYTKTGDRCRLHPERARPVTKPRLVSLRRRARSAS